MSRGWDDAADNVAGDAADEAAALWVARHIGGMIDATEFNAWLAGAPGNRARFDALWATCMDPAVSDALDRIDGRQELSETPASRVRPAIAAGMIAVAALIALVVLLPTIRFALAPAQEYATRVGEVRTFALADGSQVTLSGLSRVKVKLGEDRREVTLQAGEAFFDVRHDGERPFSVRAGDARATVLGTRFDVALTDARTELSVEQGLVRFGADDQDRNAVLVPADHGAALDAGQLEAVRKLDGGPVAAWRDGWIEAEDMPLWRLVSQLQRWTDRPIRIADHALGDKRVAGRFRLGRAEQQLDNLASLHGFRLHRSDSEYVISSH